MLYIDYVSSVHSALYSSALCSVRSALTMLCKSLFYIAFLAMLRSSIAILCKSLKSLGFLVVLLYTVQQRG